MNYLLDTNIIVIYAKDGIEMEKLEAKYHLLSGDHNIAISVVTLGELKSITKQFKYGKRKKRVIENLLKKFVKIDINIESIIDRYAEIDAFSQGNLEERRSNFSARNMGKNDLWIAAASSVYDLILLTTDKDFSHLDNEYLQLEYIDINELRKN